MNLSRKYPHLKGFCCVCQDELLAELDELEQEELDKNLLEIGGPENAPLPNVPSSSLPSRPGKSLLEN